MVREQILVIDDDPALNDLLCKAFAASGLKPISAKDGEEAYKLFVDNTPDALVVDALIPKVNGFELVAKIRRTDHGNQIPILMISGIYKALRMTDQIRELDINDFLEKPFSVEDLVQRLKELLLVHESKEIVREELKQKGKIEEIGVARILYLLFLNQENGVLFLASGKRKKKITIRNGEPTFVEGNLVQECLGKLLVKKGRLTQDQVDESLKIMKSKRTKQGETLINMGALTPNELDEALKDQAREKLLETFTWDEGNYQFTKSKDLQHNLTPIDISLPQILVRGVRSGMLVEAIKKELAPHLNLGVKVRKPPPISIDQFRLATWDERILHEIDGEKTLKQLVESKAAREEDVYQLLYVFFVTDTIEFIESEDTKKEKATITKLKHTLSKLEKQNYFDILEVKSDSTEQQLFQGLSRKLTMYHPTTSNLNPTNSPKVADVLHKITQLLKEAHEVLSNPEKRKEYERNLMLEEGPKDHDVSETFDSDIEFKKLKVEVDRGDYDRAYKGLKPMTRLFPKDWRFKTYCGWSHFKLACREKKQSKEDLKGIMTMVADGIKLNPSEAQGYFFMGHIYKYLGEQDNARNFFNKATEMDPNHVDAERELRLILMREQKANKSFIKWK